MHTGVSLSLRGTTFSNNSVVSITDIGDGEDALLCHTDNTQCCRVRDNLPDRVAFGLWFFPNGDEVGNDDGDFFRNRGESIVRLNRRNNAHSPTGRYRCEIPDASSEEQTLYVDVGELVQHKPDHTCTHTHTLTHTHTHTHTHAHTHTCTHTHTHTCTNALLYAA